MRLFLMLLLSGFFATSSFAQDNQHDERMAGIIDQGMNHSQVMLPAQQLADDIGGRLTNSPAMRKAEDWALQRFRAIGLSRIRKDPFAFGRGWSFTHVSVFMLSPRPLALHAIPVAWTPPTAGSTKGQVIVAPIDTEADFAAWRGKLRGKIVLFSEPGVESATEPPRQRRLDSQDIAALDSYIPPRERSESDERQFLQRIFLRKVDAFLEQEGAVAWARISRTEDGLVHGESYDYQIGKTPRLPGFELAAKDYRRLARLAAMGTPPVLELSSDARYDDSDLNAYNIIAEIPGTDPKSGYVMAGAHLDSWVAGDGAADNGAGCAMVLEAARILMDAGVRPKRSIRFILWSGEEQGMVGSTAYVEKYLASRPAASEPENGAMTLRNWPDRFPVTIKPGYEDLAAYFNVDGGSGKLRGIRAQNNVAAAPILKEWLRPFAAMGAGHVVASTSSRSDHYLMRIIGLPSFGFIQDPLDYDRDHHSDLDTFDHLRAEDMRQGATVLAGVLFQAAQSNMRLPRLPVPTQRPGPAPYAAGPH